MKFTILVADDERNIREGLAEALRLEGYEVALAADGEEALRAVEEGRIDLVVTDLRMPKVSGNEVLKRVAGSYPGMPVIVLTGHGTIEDAVDSMRVGAFDFITKPVNLDHLSMLIRRALESRELERQNQELQREIESQKRISSIIGRSPEMKKIFDLLRRVAPTKASVLITGESGVGKELIADALHNLSRGRTNPSSRSTAPPWRNPSWRASSSATRREPSRGPRGGNGDASSWPMREPSSSTRSGRSTRTSRSRSSGSCRNGISSGSGARRPWRLMSG